METSTYKSQPIIFIFLLKKSIIFISTHDIYVIWFYNQNVRRQINTRTKVTYHIHIAWLNNQFWSTLLVKPATWSGAKTFVIWLKCGVARCLSQGIMFLSRTKEVKEKHLKVYCPKHAHMLMNVQGDNDSKL